MCSTASDQVHLFFCCSQSWSKTCFLMWHYSCTVQWNPALWTPLKNIHLRYCAHFVWSRMHFTHACVRSEPMKCRNPPVLRNADKFPSSSNSWTVQNSLNNPDAHLPLCKIMCHIWWIAHCAIFSRPCMANSKVWKCGSPALIHIPRPPEVGAPLYPDFPYSKQQELGNKAMFTCDKESVSISYLHWLKLWQLAQKGRLSTGNVPLHSNL